MDVRGYGEKLSFSVYVRGLWGGGVGEQFRRGYKLILRTQWDLKHQYKRVKWTKLQGHPFCWQIYKLY